MSLVFEALTGLSNIITDSVSVISIDVTTANITNANITTATVGSLKDTGLSPFQTVCTDSSSTLVSQVYSDSAVVNSFLVRDAFANSHSNNFVFNETLNTTIGATIYLTASSSAIQVSTSGCTYYLPDPTTISVGHTFSFINDSSTNIAIYNDISVLIYTTTAGSYISTTLRSRLGSEWDIVVMAPDTVSWGWSLLSFPGNINVQNITCTEITCTGAIGAYSLTATGAVTSNSVTAGIINATVSTTAPYMFSNSITLENLGTGTPQLIISNGFVGLTTITAPATTSTMFQFPPTTSTAGQLLQGGALGATNWTSSPTITALTVSSFTDTGLSAFQTVCTDSTSTLVSQSYSASATTNSFLVRDAFANSHSNNFVSNETLNTTVAATIYLTASSSAIQVSTEGCTYYLPDPTTISVGHTFSFNNGSSTTIAIYNDISVLIYTLTAGGYISTTLRTSLGSIWDIIVMVPNTVSWGWALMSFPGNINVQSITSTGITNTGSISTVGLSATGVITTTSLVHGSLMTASISMTTDSMFSNTLTLENRGVGTPYLIISDGSLGLTTISAPASTATTFMFPTTTSTAGQILQGGTGGATSWTATPSITSLSATGLISTAGSVTAASMYANQIEAFVLFILANTSISGNSAVSSWTFPTTGTSGQLLQAGTSGATAWTSTPSVTSLSATTSITADTVSATTSITTDTVNATSIINSTVLWLASGSAGSPQIVMSNGIGFTNLLASSTGICTFCFPVSNGTAGQLLATDGLGNTSWVNFPLSSSCAIGAYLSSPVSLTLSNVSQNISGLSASITLPTGNFLIRADYTVNFTSSTAANVYCYCSTTFASGAGSGTYINTSVTNVIGASGFLKDYGGGSYSATPKIFGGPITITVNVKIYSATGSFSATVVPGDPPASGLYAEGSYLTLSCVPA